MSWGYTRNMNDYYRVHYGKRANERDPTRDRILMIMDKNMEPVAEIKLPEHFTDSYFVCEDVIYFYLRNETDDMYLAKVKIEENK